MKGRTKELLKPCIKWLKTSEKMPSTSYDQGTASQNQGKILPHTCQNGYDVSKCMEIREPLFAVDGYTNWHNHYGKEYECPLKTDRP